MTAPGNSMISTALAVVLLLAVTYAFGRLHQWYRQTTDRDEAYRDGYNRATTSLFAMACQLSRGAEAPAEHRPTVTSMRPRRARHRAEDKDEITENLWVSGEQRSA